MSDDRNEGFGGVIGWGLFAEVLIVAVAFTTKEEGALTVKANSALVSTGSIMLISAAAAVILGSWTRSTRVGWVAIGIGAIAMLGYADWERFLASGAGVRLGVPLVVAFALGAATLVARAARRRDGGGGG